MGTYMGECGKATRMVRVVMVLETH